MADLRDVGRWTLAAACLSAVAGVAALASTDHRPLTSRTVSITPQVTDPAPAGSARDTLDGRPCPSTSWTAGHD